VPEAFEKVAAHRKIRLQGSGFRVQEDHDRFTVQSYRFTVEKVE
jgi:hypothetical protein